MRIRGSEHIGYRDQVGATRDVGIPRGQPARRRVRRRNGEKIDRDREDEHD